MTSILLPRMISVSSISRAVVFSIANSDQVYPLILFGFRPSLSVTLLGLLSNLCSCFGHCWELFL